MIEINTNLNHIGLKIIALNLTVKQLDFISNTMGCSRSYIIGLLNDPKRVLNRADSIILKYTGSLVFKEREGLKFKILFLLGCWAFFVLNIFLTLLIVSIIYSPNNLQDFIELYFYHSIIYNN